MQSFGRNQAPDCLHADNIDVEFATIDQPRDEGKRQRPKQMTSVVDGRMKQSFNLISESRNRFLSRSYKKPPVDDESGNSSFQSVSNNVSKPNNPFDATSNSLTHDSA
jgi:hypothetical protein